MKMIKRTAILFAVVLAFAMCCTFGAGAANETFTLDGITYEVVSVGVSVRLDVKSVDSTLSGKVVIPAEIQGSGSAGIYVKYIDSYAFEKCSEITEVILPDSITTIGECAFVGCTALEKVTFGSGVSKINKSAFYGCTNLREIVVPEANADFSTDENGILYNKDKSTLIWCPADVAGTSFTVPVNVKRIATTAFASCTELAEITFAGEAPAIEKDAFRGTAFYKNDANRVNGGLYLGNYLLEVEAEGEFAVKDGTEHIAENAFTDSGVTSVIFPKSLKVIGAKAFFGCKTLKNISIPSTVKEIGQSAFSETNPEWVSIKLGVERIGSNAFSSYGKIYFEGSKEQWESIEFVGGVFEADYFNHPEAAHSFTDYKSDNNATIFADGTKTACCDYGCGEYDTVADEGSMIAFGKPETVTSAQNTSAIRLTWSGVPGATGYRIFYKTASGWKKCATLTGTSHTFTGLKAAAKYTFAVRAYNIDGDTVTWAASYATLETSTQAVAPAKIAAAQNTSAIKLTWTACPGATGYRIYYKLPSDTAWKVSVSTTNKTTHTYTKLKAGAKYDFAIRPYIKTADAVIWSAYTTYTATTTPATVEEKVSSPSVGAITVSWNAVNGADGYRVYYKLNNGSYKLYGTYTSATTLNFSNLKGGDKYTFAVRAGIRTSGGVVWGGYQEKSVTLAYRITRYLNAIKNGTYYIETHDGQGYYDGVAMKNGSFCVRMNYGGEVLRVVYDKKTNKVYDIYDTGKEYVELVDDGTFAAMASELSGLDVNMKISKSTTEKIGSKTYFVETQVTEEGFVDKYYFDGATLVMEKISYEGESIVYYYSQFINKVPDSLFTVPSNYKKVTA